MTRGPHELFKRPPFMQRTVRDDAMVLVSGLIGFTAAYLLLGEDEPLSLVFFLGAGLLSLPVYAGVRRVIRQRRDGGSGLTPPE